MIDQPCRHEFFECVRQYDRVGRRIWQQVRLVDRIIPIAEDDLIPPSVILASAPLVLRHELNDLENTALVH